MTWLHVLSPGPSTTVQDTGRRLWMHMGVSPSGPMDALAFELANALVGNPPGTGMLEFTVTGGRYRVEDGGCRVAVAGDFDVSVNGRPVPAWLAMDLADGDELRIGTARHGLRGYLAVAGGLDLAPVLGSVSTLARARLGGLQGRALARGDRLALRAARPPDAPLLALPRHLDPEALSWRRPGPLRVVLGPQDEYFDPSQIERFLQAEYRVRPDSDRMGYRLEGPALSHRGGHDIVSDAIAHGSIQIPGDGQPIIAFADRQTTGGYPKIATLCRIDLDRAAQLAPGQAVRFRALSVEQAENLWIHARHTVDRILRTLAPA